MINVEPIAFVRNSRETTEDDYWGEVISTIELADGYTEQSLVGIEDFSHVEVIFYFDNFHKGGFSYGQISILA